MEKATGAARMTPAEYGRWLAAQSPPITDEQVEQAARILATPPRPAPPPDDRLHSVYAHISAGGELLYIGSSIDVLARSKDHRSRSPWFTPETTVEILAEGMSRREALDLEHRLIRERRPRHNQVGTLEWREARSREARIRETLRRPTRRQP